MIRKYKTPKAILRAAIRLVEDPERWTPNVLAMDMDWKAVAPEAPEAVRWCAVGALERHCGVKLPVDTRPEILGWYVGLDITTLQRLNDGPNGHSAALRYMRQALRRLESPS